MYPRRCVDHDLGGVVSRPSMGHARKRDERRCDHGCKDLSRTCLSSLSRLMSLFRNVHVRLPGVCTGCCNECPVPRLDRSTPSEWDCNRDPMPIPKNRRVWLLFLLIAEEKRYIVWRNLIFVSRINNFCVYVEHNNEFTRENLFSKAWN